MRLSNRCWLAWFTILLCYHLTSSMSYPPEVIRHVEINLLSLLGFKKRPPMADSNKLVVPEEIKRLYELQNRLKFTSHIPKRGAYLTSANTVRSFVHVKSRIDQRFHSHHKMRLKFMPKIPEDEMFQHAELVLKRTEQSKSGKLQILVEDILKPGRKGLYGPIKKVIDSKTVNVATTTTIQLDLTGTVKRWLENPKTNHGVLVRILQLSGFNIKRSYDADPFQPVLYTYTDDKKNSESNIRDVALRLQRNKRSVRRGKKKEDRSLCKRHSMYVNFAEVGWSDWIVAPSGYDAFYCQGDCPFPLADHLNTTNAAIVQTLMHSVRPTTVPKACCIPKQLNSISLLYRDADNSVTLKIFKEMSVAACGCL